MTQSPFNSPGPRRWSKRFASQRVLITGAAGGIGKALVFDFLRSGADVLAVDRDRDGLRKLEATVAGNTPPAGTGSGSDALLVDLTTRVSDLSDLSAVDDLARFAVDDWGPVDILVNNAGIAYYGPTDRMSSEQWDRILTVNLHAPIRLTSALLPELLKRPDGHLVNMCSISGLVAGGRFAAYHTSKFGLIGFTEAIRAEYGRRGFGVTAVCPGPVATDLYRSTETAESHQAAPEPPRWMATTAEVVSEKTLNAVIRNRRQLLITPTAHALYQLKRFVPGLIDFANQFSRKKKKRRQARIAALQSSRNTTSANKPPRAA